MNIELINTGAELLVGRILNTHQQWLCRQLADLGYEVSRQTCVPDEGQSIQTAVGESLQRADVVITTGGLGPTSDDLTRDYIARLLGRKLVLHEPTRDWINHYFASRKRPMPASVQVQAMIPEGATVLPNPNGTAPGLAIESGARLLILLPGPPRELRPMFLDSVVPLLHQKFPLAAKFVSHNFKTTGLGESLVEERIAGPLQPLIQQGLEVAYCARIGEVDVRLSARGEQAPQLLARGKELVITLLGPIIFGSGDETLESVIIRMLIERKKTLALAESCTGGFLANRLTNVPGASEVFLGGIVSYSNAIKQKQLGVRAESLERDGAVSTAVAKEMAEGARRRLKSDYAISITGIAGPGGGSTLKPVGTAFIGLSASGKTTVQLQYSPVDRETFKFVVSQRALDILRHALTA